MWLLVLLWLSPTGEDVACPCPCAVNPARELPIPMPRSELDSRGGSVKVYSSFLPSPASIPNPNPIPSPDPNPSAGMDPSLGVDADAVVGVDASVDVAADVGVSAPLEVLGRGATALVLGLVVAVVAAPILGLLLLLLRPPPKMESGMEPATELDPIALSSEYTDEETDEIRPRPWPPFVSMTLELVVVAVVVLAVALYVVVADGPILRLPRPPRPPTAAKARGVVALDFVLPS